MKYLAPTILIASLAVSSLPVYAAHTTQGPDIEASTRLSMKECLAMQAAKHDRASRDDMKKACKWTADDTYSTNSLSSSERPRAIDTEPYGQLPGTATPQ